MDSNKQPKKDELEQKEWVGRFLNYPPKSQIEFLLRHQLEESIRKKVEDEILGDNKNEQP
ncbi:hypothetical protein [Bacillus sp. MUM 13]|uniref:hypothetical protein n=1 Tax=Bacillus sp. MUM 13 TaxID=1678001 RepID=UPI0008F566F9|nr:hypothetical protein [Bacillus sp. MUM 13]OIK10059.1 hypothetical protein BIV59_15095 [Bacillus sp. MUM 13]